ncbi:MAG: HAD hydrolase family protein [Methanomassiliicoccales archaeon]
MDEAFPFEGKILVSDLQGPITANDSAREITAAVVENGDRLYQAIRRYERVLSNVSRKEGVKPGDSLRLILPFLKAYGVTDSSLLRFSKDNLRIVPGADKAMRFAQELMSSFVVSTSYEHYVGAACDHIGFPFENTFCTRLSMDMLDIEDWETETLCNLAQEIVRLPLLEVPEGTSNVRDLSTDDRIVLRRLDEIFWTEMTDLSTYQLVSQVNPVGGDEKATSVVEICKRMSVPLEDCMYVGDGETDARVLQVVKRSGGLSIAFNGNLPALREAEVGVVSDNAIVTSILTELFHRGGRDGVLEALEDWSLDGLRANGVVHDYLLREFARTFPGGLPTVRRLDKTSLQDVVRESVPMREKVRGFTDL